MCVCLTHALKESRLPFVYSLSFLQLVSFFTVVFSFFTAFFIVCIVFYNSNFCVPLFLKRWWCIEVLALLSLYIWLIPPDIYACLKD